MITNELASGRACPQKHGMYNRSVLCVRTLTYLDGLHAEEHWERVWAPAAAAGSCYHSGSLPGPGPGAGPDSPRACNQPQLLHYAWRRLVPSQAISANGLPHQAEALHVPTMVSGVCHRELDALNRLRAPREMGREGVTAHFEELPVSYKTFWSIELSQFTFQQPQNCEPRCSPHYREHHPQ
jgi:hypothetical protein